MSFANDLADRLIAAPHQGLSEAEALRLLTCEDLPRAAARLTQRFRPHAAACAIISAKSGRCSENCSFCAQSSHHQAAIAPHELLSPQAILSKAKAAAESGAERFGIVTSGLKLTAAEFEQVCETISLLKQTTGLSICASLGLLNSEQAARLKAAGLSRYHHNLETAASYFGQVCTTHAYEQDLATVRTAKAAGLKTCCGGIFGLGESWTQRVELGLTLAALNVDAVPVNFLNPRSGTPLADRPLLPAETALRTLSLLRFLNPQSEIIVAGGRPTVLGERQSEIFAYGASALMIGDYLTTSGAELEADRRLLAAQRR